MAKNKSQGEETLLDEVDTTTENGSTEPVKSPEEYDAEIKAIQDRIKELRRLKKGEKPKVEKEIKGVMVSFKNKAGEEITGMGSRYYVVRFGGKLHYKQEDAVHVMTDEEVAAYNASKKEELA